MAYATQKSSKMRIYTVDNRRLYLNASERRAFIDAACKAPEQARRFCLFLVHTGCRISEARYLRPCDLQIPESIVSLHTLKRREPGHVREVPMPPDLCMEFMFRRSGAAHDGFVFADGRNPPPRITTYRWVKTVMRDAGIIGPQACPKGLRHGFGVQATRTGVQLHMLQKWMGHADMSTTAIYATALGPEELEIAARMW